MVGRGISSTSPHISRTSLFLTTKYMPSHTPHTSDDVYLLLLKSLKPLHRGPVIPPTREGRAELKRLRMEREQADAARRRQAETLSEDRATTAGATSLETSDGPSRGTADTLRNESDSNETHGVVDAEPEPYIDLFLIHAPWGGQKGREANWAALARAQKEGWVRDIGVSNLYVYLYPSFIRLLSSRERLGS